MMESKSKSELDWEKFLDFELTKKNFIYSSFYLFIYEMLKNTIIERIKSFYFKEFANNEILYDDKYKELVLNKKFKGKQNLFLAHLHWLNDSDVISQDDIVQICKIRDHRNFIAHHTDKLLSNSGYEINFALLNQAMNYIKKIENWWIVEFEIPINPDFDNKEIDEEGIISGSEVLIDYYKTIIDSFLDKSK